MLDRVQAPKNNVYYSLTDRGYLRPMKTGVTRPLNSAANYTIDIFHNGIVAPAAAHILKEYGIMDIRGDYNSQDHSLIVQVYTFIYTCKFYPKNEELIYYKTQITKMVEQYIWETYASEQ